MKNSSCFLAAPLVLGGFLGDAYAQAEVPASADAWKWGVVLDTAATSRPLVLGGRDQGLQLGHSDVSAEGPIGRHLQAKLTAVFATHEGETAKAFEEVWVETRTLPWGLSARAGRFASQIGYLNQQHPHADDFTERPLLYRAFLGGHWYDDGLRLNVTLPTSWYWVVGTEVFRGRQLVPESSPAVAGAGAVTFSTKMGGDISRAQSWQLGLSYLRSRRQAPVPEHGHEEEAAEHDSTHEHDQEHHHGSRWSGRHLWMVDATWKWAPEGNNREQQVRLNAEVARVSGFRDPALSGQRHDAFALSAVWRIRPQWEVGARMDRLKVAMPHDEHVDNGRLNEKALMVAWRPSHRQSLRLQLARQSQASGFEDPARRSVSLQYILAFGAHGAHAY